MSNNFVIGDRSNNAVTVRTVDTGTGHQAQHVISDVAGTPFTNTYGFPVADASVTPKGFYQNTAVSTTGATLATIIGTTLPSGARIAWIQPEGGDIRLRDDGSAPTATVGLRIYSGTSWPYNGTLSACQLAAVTGTVTVNVLFYQ